MRVMKRVVAIFYSFTEGRNGTDGHQSPNGLGAKEKMGKGRMDASSGMYMHTDVHEMKAGPKHSIGNFDP